MSEPHAHPHHCHEADACTDDAEHPAADCAADCAATDGQAAQDRDSGCGGGCPG
ncbi:hypothetical protein [Nonomuraea phyllanthi]|uniref:hypothetical protein n=1 Tax=Nonomuraea phyllanthi TaxID=2219224 RepID=UPI00186B0618|nr:hypothetical protein [Nonomuraea phyllanthi]